MKGTIKDYLIQLQKLTQTNLDLMKALNDSFTTRRDHLAVNVGDAQYIMPSFLSLENKINALTENFNNLVSSPQHGDAYFTIDGNARAIRILGYNNVPNSLKLNEVTEFGVERNDIFKDFLTPNPYVNFDLSELPNDITTVNVRKVIAMSPELKEIFKGLLLNEGESEEPEYDVSKSMSYADIYKIISNYNQGTDYVMYDTVRKLPIRTNIGSGSYAIAEVISDTIDDDYNEFVTFEIRTDLENYQNTLTYKLFDETIQRNLVPGDQLITWDGSAKMEIIEVYPSRSRVTVRIMNGDYLNIIGTPSGSAIPDSSKLRFFCPDDFDADKYLHVSLEEDQYIFIAIAPMNDVLNTQSSWGQGVLVDTFDLVNENGETYKDFYKNIRNVGDVLYEMTSLMNSQLTHVSEDDFNAITSLVPTIDTDNVTVVQINSHLNDSTSVKNIRSAYSQKKQYEMELEELQGKIDGINQKLAKVSFASTSSMRTVYTDQLNQYNARKDELMASITRAILEISQAANDSVVPIENAKYHIRGFFDYKKMLDGAGYSDLADNVAVVEVQYRYKNIDQTQGTALTINDQFTFSDWNVQRVFPTAHIPYYQDGYRYRIDETSEDALKNIPHKNQIDIPISQGETVDIKVRVVFDLGSPFAVTRTDWSEITNIKFPEEYLKDVQVLDIITENNRDIETNRFKGIIEESGIMPHVDDKIQDQDITYFHKPESIASGFYTAERRIIPLKDKLVSIDSLVSEMYGEITGANSESLKVSVRNGTRTTTLTPWQINNVAVAAYSTLDTTKAGTINGTYNIDNRGIVSTILNIDITNTSQLYTIKLYSMFPGPRTTILNNARNTKFRTDDYVGNKNVIYDISTQMSDTVLYPQYEEDEIESATAASAAEPLGIWFKYGGVSNSSSNMLPQTMNQFITFRRCSVYDDTDYYKNFKSSSFLTSLGDGSHQPWEGQQTVWLSMNKEYTPIMVPSSGTSGVITAAAYPCVSNKYGLCLETNTQRAFHAIAPGETITVPIVFEYFFGSGINDNSAVNSIYKTISFDLRPSLYADPINYTFRINAKWKDTIQDRLLYIDQSVALLEAYEPIIADR